MTSTNSAAPGADEMVSLQGHVVWRRVDDEVVALDLESSRYVGLNESAALLWAALADGATRASLVQVLVATYAVGAGVASTDVDAFLAECRARSLVRS